MAFTEKVSSGQNLEPPDPRKEYFKALEKWLLDAYTWENVSASFSYMLMSNEFNVVDQNGINHRLGFPRDPSVGNLSPPSESTARPVPAPAPFQRPQPTEPNIGLQGQAVQCRIPPVWKRVVAEFLDFLILFFLKLAITFIAVDFFDIINLDKYGIQVMDPSGNINYKMVLAATSEILVLEFIHRIVVCIFEAYWLRRGTGGLVGGATPGKAMMGLRVLACSKVENMDNRPLDVVLVQPGTDLGLTGAISRAVLKNIILAVLFPLCFALFFFKHNRTGYDVVCHSIVVEGYRRQRP